MGKHGPAHRGQARLRRWSRKDLPARNTLHDYLGRWEWDGTLARIHHALYVQCRERAGRNASPTVAVIDSQVPLMATVFGLRPFLRTLYADGGYAGP